LLICPIIRNAINLFFSVRYFFLSKLALYDMRRFESVLFFWNGSSVSCENGSNKIKNIVIKSCHCSGFLKYLLAFTLTVWTFSHYSDHPSDSEQSEIFKCKTIFQIGLLPNLLYRVLVAVFYFSKFFFILLELNELKL
jgi:hypothetical protein